MNKYIPDVGNALQSVIKMNGEDLLHGDTPCLFHITYVVSATGALDYLEVWSSTLVTLGESDSSRDMNPKAWLGTSNL
jgi:hypothetical protein